MEGYGKEIGLGALILLFGFRLAGFPALRLASFSAPIGQDYTLIYAVVMYSSLYSYIRCHDTFLHCSRLCITSSLRV